MTFSFLAKEKSQITIYMPTCMCVYIVMLFCREFLGNLENSQDEVHESELDEDIKKV